MSDTSRSDAAWAIRGIPLELRGRVVDRARAEGRTVGAWVASALNRALEGDALADQVMELRRRIELLESRQTAADR